MSPSTAAWAFSPSGRVSADSRDGGVALAVAEHARQVGRGHGDAHHGAEDEHGQHTGALARQAALAEAGALLDGRGLVGVDLELGRFFVGLAEAGAAQALTELDRVGLSLVGGLQDADDVLGRAVGVDEQAERAGHRRGVLLAGGVGEHRREGQHGLAGGVDADA